MRKPTPPVRDFGLYGESRHLPDVMHCETIAERSVLHDWEFAPHRHERLQQVLVLRDGRGVVRLGSVESELAPGALVNVPIGEVHAFTFEPGTDGLVLTLADVMLDELLARSIDVRRRLRQGWVGTADPQTDDLMTQLASEYAAASPARALVLRGLAAALLGRVARLAAGAEAESGGLASSHLLQRFEALLESHFREHWRVADYARALSITPTHLCRLVRAATGTPPSQVIDARVVREARRQIAFTSLSLSSIAYTLGFADPALFSRVFSRVAGLSPSAFRRQLAAR